MVVLATSVCTKNGKVLVSRQFVSIPRSRIEGLLAAFPKLLSGNDNQQHTFIETTSVRYLYQRFEDLFLVVITNKASNIVEDLETLRILTKVVPDYCGATLNEKAIVENGFELIFAFDEVVSLGYKESVTLEQIRTFTELDSHEEKIHEMIEKNKEREAREEAKRRMKEIEREKREREKMGITSGMSSIGSGSMGGMGSGMGGMGSGMGGMGSGMGGMGSGMGGMGSGMGGMGSGMGGMGSGMGSGTGQNYGGNSSMSGGNYSNSPDPQKSSKSDPRKPRRGLQIVKKPQSQGLIEQLNQEGDHLPVSSSSTPLVKEPEVISEAVQIAINERILCSFDNEGGLQQLQVLGEFLVTITDIEAVNAQIQFQELGDLQTRIHPNISRDLFAKGVLAIVQNKSYPLDTPTGVLKWRLQSTDDNQVPIRVNVWPSRGSHSQLLVNVEYELNPHFELSDVSIKFNIVGKSAPVISTEQGSTRFDSKSNTLEWYLPLINHENSRGTLDLEIQQWDNDSDHSWLYPVAITFISNSTFARLKITSVQDATGNPIPFSERRSLEVQQYTIGNK